MTSMPHRAAWSNTRFLITDIIVDALHPNRSQVKFGNGMSLLLKEVVGNVTADHKARYR